MRLAIILGLGIGILAGCGKFNQTETESIREQTSSPSNDAQSESLQSVVGLEGDKAAFALSLPDEMIAEAEGVPDRPEIPKPIWSRFRIVCGPIAFEEETEAHDSENESMPEIIKPYATIHLSLETYGDSGDVSHESASLPYFCGIGQRAIVEVLKLNRGFTHVLSAKVADFRGTTVYAGRTKFIAGDDSRPLLVLKRVWEESEYVDVLVDVVFENPAPEPHPYCEPRACPEYAIDGVGVCRAIWAPGSPNASALLLETKSGNKDCAAVDMWAKACELVKKDPGGKLESMECENIFNDHSKDDIGE